MKLITLARRCVLLGLLASALAASAQGTTAPPITVRDDRGTEHRFASPPQRIVTLLPSSCTCATRTHTSTQKKPELWKMINATGMRQAPQRYMCHDQRQNVRRHHTRVL